LYIESEIAKKNQSSLKNFKKILIYYYEKYDELPSNEWLMDRLQLSTYAVNKYLHSLKKKGFLIKDKNKWIVNKHSYKKKNSEVANEFYENDERRIPVDHRRDSVTVRYQKGETKEKEKQENPVLKNIWIDILRGLLFFIGVGATYMSIYYSQMWLQEFLNFSLSLLLALVMVLYAVGSFELIILFRIKRKFLMMIVFSFLWIIVSVFSMVSTIAGQYNGRMEKIQSMYTEKNKQFQNNQEVKKYNDSMQTYKEQLKDIQEQDQQIYKLLSNYDTVEKINANRRIYNRLTWNRYKNNKKKEELLKKIEQLKKEKPLEILQKDKKNFYRWVDTIFHIGADRIQFWLSIFPAIFIDIVAPFSFAVVIFIKS